jgi:hypothetical protein
VNPVDDIFGLVQNYEKKYNHLAAIEIQSVAYTSCDPVKSVDIIPTETVENTHTTSLAERIGNFFGRNGQNPENFDDENEWNEDLIFSPPRVGEFTQAYVLSPRQQKKLGRIIVNTQYVVMISSINQVALVELAIDGTRKDGVNTEIGRNGMPTIDALENSKHGLGYDVKSWDAVARSGVNSNSNAIGSADASNPNLNAMLLMDPNLVNNIAPMSQLAVSFASSRIQATLGLNENAGPREYSIAVVPAEVAEIMHYR